MTTEDKEVCRLYDEMICAAKANDDEVAHSREDAMRDRVLLLISEGAPNAAGLAKFALESNKIPFSRWCA